MSPLDNLEFTDNAKGSFNNVVNDTHFYENDDARLIYEQLEKNLHAIPFCNYLKRYIYKKAGMTGNFLEIPLDEYRFIIRESFRDNDTPASFTPTSAKLSALTKNWLTQQTVRRDVVLLLGFGLSMRVEDVNEFLTKGIKEPEINFKNPFEILCHYCYKNRLGFKRFWYLWNLFCETPADESGTDLLLSEQTANIHLSVDNIQDETTLVSYLLKLKNDRNQPVFSVTARRYFDMLYTNACRLIADLYNAAEEERHARELEKYRDALYRNDRLYNFEKSDRITQKQNNRRIYRAEDITESDIEHVMYAAVPMDHHGNLIPTKTSRLKEQFQGKRLHRQHLHEILTGAAGIDRFDLITLNFFIYSQKVDEIPSAEERLNCFTVSTDTILQSCSMGKLYIANPYECFLQMCMLSEEPLATFADVWELSYQNNEI